MQRLPARLPVQEKLCSLKDRCCHRGAPLSLGRLEGDCVRCMYHGLKFDPAGKCIQIPGQDNIPAKLACAVIRWSSAITWCGS